MSDFKIVQSSGWPDFRTSLLNYARLPRARRDELWFRGHGDNTWKLSTTLDRFQAGLSVSDRQSLNKKLLSAFKVEAQHIATAESFLGTEQRLELLARHHGLPSPLMDWSLSPYVASYIAFESYDKSQNPDFVSVWCLDVNRIDWTARRDIEMLWHDLPVFENRRALQQRGVFLRTAKSQPLEELIPEVLTRFDLPVSDRELAMQDLDEMMVNATTMFYDLEGAAKTAAFRLAGS